MKVEDVSLLSVDIETTGVDRHAGDAKVLLISNTYRKSGKLTRKLFDITKYESETEMINAWCEWVNKIDPSLIIGHNVLGFDLPYLDVRSANGLNIGRDGSPIRFDQKESKFRKDGSQKYGYYNARIHGREIIDTFFLSIKYDISRQFPSYGLKPIVEYLGLEKENRIKWDFENNLPKDIINDSALWEQFCEYAEDDADDSIKLFDIMVPSFFYLNQSIPKPFQQIINEATGSQLDSFMIRSYLQNGYSQPKTSDVHPYDGAISMGVPGVYKNVYKWDVASLYPSIMLQYDISDISKDPKKHMLKALDYFRTQRLEDKRLGQETGDKYYKDLDASRKIVINSLYGFLGAGYLLYNFVEGAAKVTEHGREILQKGIEWATGHRLIHEVKKIVNEGKPNEEKKYHWVVGPKTSEGRGYDLVNVDTDSFSVTNGNKMSKEKAESELDNLNSIYEDLITWEKDGEFDNFVVIRAKNYVMNESGKIKYKGSGLKDQKKELALQEFLHECIDDIMFNNSNKILDIYHTYIREAMNMKDVSRWVVKKTVTENLFESSRANETKVVDAIERSSTNVNMGDKIWVYSAIDGEKQAVVKGEPKFYKDGTPKMIPNKILKMQSEWAGDEDRLHYVERVYKTLMILENLLDKDQFIDYSKKSNKKLLEKLCQK
jgi:DNA polymerase elongation subunit (family B)